MATLSGCQQQRLHSFWSINFSAASAARLAALKVIDRKDSALQYQRNEVIFLAPLIRDCTLLQDIVVLLFTVATICDSNK